MSSVFHRVMGGVSSVMGWLRGMPEGSASSLEAITAHADRIMGAQAQHFHEKYSPDVHVDLLHYPPAGDRAFHYVVTSGMSDRPMATDGAVEKPFLELVIALPAHWDVSMTGFERPEVWQPFRLLKQLARYPHNNNTFFAKTHTVSTGDDPLLSPMKGVLFMPPVLVPEFRSPLDSGDGKNIQFLAPYLLHEDELELKLNDGLDRLLKEFGERNVTEMYDLERPSVLR